MKKMYLILFVLIFTIQVSGCSVYSAAKAPPPVDFEKIQLGSERGYVIDVLGKPTFSESKDDKLIDHFSFIDGNHAGTKSRIILYVAGDLFTLCLAELIFWPLEEFALQGGERKAFVKYKNESEVFEIKVESKDGDEVFHHMIDHEDNHPELSSYSPEVTVELPVTIEPEVISDFDFQPVDSKTKKQTETPIEKPVPVVTSIEQPSTVYSYADGISALNQNNRIKHNTQVAPPIQESQEQSSIVEKNPNEKDLNIIYDKLLKLKGLKESGIITTSEYEQRKKYYLDMLAPVDNDLKLEKLKALSESRDLGLITDEEYLKAVKSVNK